MLHNKQSQNHSIHRNRCSLLTCLGPGMCFSCLGFLIFLGATWLFANPGWPLLHTWSDVPLLHVSGTRLDLCSCWQQRCKKPCEDKQAYAQKWQSHPQRNKCKLKQIQVTGKINVGVQCWWNDAGCSQIWWRENQLVNLVTWCFGKYAVPFTWMEYFWGFILSKQRSVQRWVYTYT